MKKLIYKAALLLLLPALIITGCKKDDDQPKNLAGEFELEMDHFFNGQTFSLNTTYTNAAGEDVTFDLAKYYVSNIVLTAMDGSTWAEEESYHLVDLSNHKSTHIHVKDVPRGEYKAISFLIGVDSTRNVSGAQEGALSVTNGMFWSWNTGYIFLRLEGNSGAAPSGQFSYHLGGFMHPNNAAKEVVTEFVKGHGHHSHGKPLKIAPNSKPVAHYYVDMAKFFVDHHDGSPFRIATKEKHHPPGPFAVEMIKNFTSGIEFDHLHE